MNEIPKQRLLVTVLAQKEERIKREQQTIIATKYAPTSATLPYCCRVLLQNNPGSEARVNFTV